MKPEDIEGELNRLWERVSSAPMAGEEPVVTPPVGIDVSSVSREATLEAVALIKRQHREQLAHWQEMAQLKEKILQDLSQRLRDAEAELDRLRRAASGADQRILHDTTELAAKLEAAGQALRAQEERFKSEETLLRDILDKTRQQLAAETKRWHELERQWNGREQQYLEQVRELDARLARAQDGVKKQEGESQRLAGDLKEAKKAIEGTFGELMAERKLREEADRERQRAHERVSEVTDHLKQLQGQWEEERKQWQELWDRERSTWETQRQEFSTWEERLRKEREAWHSQLKAEEDKVLHFSDQMTKTLRESSETSEKISKIFKAVTGGASGIWGPFPRVRMKRWAAALAALAVLASGYPVWKHVRQLRFTLVTSHALPLDNPTAISFDGTVLWAVEWSGRLVSFDPSNPANVLGRYVVSSGIAYRPVSVTTGAGALWSLDSAQGRIVKHRLADPSVVQLGWASPGPGPVALAHDGQNLWSYDAVTKSAYRHMGEGPKAETEAYPFDLDIVPTSMQWMGDRLWVHDSKGKQILRFKLDGKTLRLVDAQRFEPSAVSIALYRALEDKSPRPFLWALCADGAGGFSLKKYRVSP